MVLQYFLRAPAKQISSKCNILNMIINSVKYIRKIIIDNLMFVHKISNIFTNSGVTIMHEISNNSTKQLIVAIE